MVGSRASGTVNCPHYLLLVRIEDSYKLAHSLDLFILAIKQ